VGISIRFGLPLIEENRISDNSQFDYRGGMQVSTDTDSDYLNEMRNR
jgi:hypothetical protein